MTVEISEEIIKSTLEDILKTFEKKREKKGSLSFNSMSEIYGKLQEENYEVLKEFHKKDQEKFCLELKDVIVVGIWGIASIRANQEKTNG